MNLHDAMEEFRAAGALDSVADGRFEFATFLELSGARWVRGTESHLRPPLLSGAFRNLDERGRVRRSGYFFRIRLPGRDGGAVCEFAGRADGRPRGCCGPSNDPVAAPARLSAPVDPARAAEYWIAYAWPIEYVASGQLTFVVDETGVVLGADCPEYSGDREPPPGAALRTGGIGSIRGPLAVDAEGQDGHAWRRDRAALFR